MDDSRSVPTENRESQIVPGKGHGKSNLSWGRNSPGPSFSPNSGKEISHGKQRTMRNVRGD